MTNEAEQREQGLHEKVALGAQAQAELDQTNAAFDRVRAGYIDLWTKSDARDTEGREKLHTAVVVIEKVREQLRIVVDNGKIADRELAEIRGEKRSRFNLVR